MQPPAPTPAKVPVQQLPATPPPATPPTGAVTSGIDRVGQITPISLLEDQVVGYAQQLAGLKAQRTIIQRQINRSSDAATRGALELRKVPLDNQIAQLEMDLASVRAQLASRQGQSETQPPFNFPPSQHKQFDPDFAAGLGFAFIFAVMMPIGIAYARRVWRGAPKDTGPRLDDVLLPRLDRLEQAVDAIAIEIERISEGQRFVTRVFAERPAAAPAQAPATPAAKEAAADAKPFLALGAGPAEPIRAAERQAVRQSVTPH
jgi:hypothetical protein